MPEALAQDHNHLLVLSRIADDLESRHRGLVSRDEVEQLLRDSYQSLAATASVQTYLPVLARHFTETRLADLVAARGGPPRPVPKVVFLCVHNAGRSQMAAALLEHHAQGRVDVRSAGSLPAGQLNPSAVAALAEIGIDLRAAYPKPVTDEVIRAADVVVSMGCGDTCPVVPGTRYLEWQLDDPSDLPVEAVRPIRDELDRRVRALLAEVTS